MTTSTNPAWAIPSHATSPKHLQLIHKPVPVPGPGEALIRLTAASLNFRDYLITTHSPHYPGNHKDMLTPGSDGAGVVHSAGPGSIWATRVGTPVVLHPNSWMDGPGSENVLDFKSVLGGDRLDGTVQGWRVVPDGQVVEAPRGFEGWETAGLLTAGATAWRAIREWLDGDVKGRLGPWKGGKDDGGSGKWRVRRLEGKTVLTQGTGGLSCAVIQVCVFFFVFSFSLFAEKEEGVCCEWLNAVVCGMVC
jgi:NADPH:quinone reductase-like Zn-dependent oxidoreductase